jgi:hypothetical protein
MINECGRVDGMIIGRGNRRVWREVAVSPLFHHRSYMT